MRTKYKPWALPYLEEHKEVQITLEEIKELNAPIYLEIGSGKGQFLSNMAKKFSDINFIGVEKNVSCSGILAKKLVEEEITNAKMIYADGKDVSEAIKSSSVKCLFLNFSDPWPKKRHDKRRLTHDNFLKEYKRILMDDGELIFKTDNFDLFEFSVEKFIELGFKIVSLTRDYDTLEEFDTMTEYEENFRNKGQKIARIVVRK
jgi:tRNA (guanine-N7-)-methyltransferase